MFARTTDAKFMMILMILSMLKQMLLFILTMTGDYHNDSYDKICDFSRETVAHVFYCI